MKVVFKVGLFLFMLTLLSPLVFASWVKDSSSGNWGDVVSRTSWEVYNSDGEVGNSWWYYDVNNFSGYYCVYNFSWFYAISYGWWEVQIDKSFQVLWNFSNIYVWVGCYNTLNWGGWINNDWVYAGVSENNSAFSYDWWCWWATKTARVGCEFDNKMSSVKVYVVKNNDTSVRVAVVVDRGYNDEVLLVDSEFSVSSSWWDSMRIEMRLFHDGRGGFRGGLWDVVYSDSEFNPSISGGSSDSSPFNDFFHNVLGIFQKALPSWLSDYLEGFSVWFGGLLPLANMLVNAGIVVLPFTPFLVLFWLLDAVFTSVKEGSFTPVGQCVSSIWDVAGQIAGLIVHIAQTIYDFIHFW